MPPSARLKENKEKQSFSSRAAGSTSAVITCTGSPRRAILAGSQPSVFQAGLNSHRQERAGAASGQEGQPRRSSPLGAQALGCSGRRPLALQGRLCHQRRTGACLRGPVPPSRSHTSHPSLRKCPPCPTVTQVLPSFPRHDLKATEGQPRDAGLPAPCPPGPVPSPPVFVTTPPQGRATPFAGSRTTCHHSCSAPANQLPIGSPPFTPAPSNRTTGTSRFLLQGSLQRLLRVSESSLGAASTVPLPAWSPALCKQAVCPAPQGSSAGALNPWTASKAPEINF